MNRLHNKHKNTNKRRTCKSNKGTRKTLKSCGCRRGRSNKKGGSKGCLSCFSKRTGPHSKSNTAEIKNEIKQLYIYTIYYGILFLHTGDARYLQIFDIYNIKLSSHIAYLTTGEPVPNEREKDSIRNVSHHVLDLEGALGVEQGTRRSQLNGVNAENIQLIRNDWQTVRNAAEQDKQHPFVHLNALLKKYTPPSSSSAV